MARLREKLPNGRRNYRANVADFEQRFIGCAHQCVQRAEMARQIRRRRFANVANAKRVNKARKRGAPGAMDSVTQVLRGCARKAFELGQGRQVEFEEISRRLDPLALDDLLDQLFTESIYIE